MHTETVPLASLRQRLFDLFEVIVAEIITITENESDKNEMKESYLIIIIIDWNHRLSEQQMHKPSRDMNNIKKRLVLDSLDVSFFFLCLLFV